MGIALLETIKPRMPIGAKVLAPVLLGAWVLCILTDIFYYGGKRESLAALAEGYFIRLSIRYAESPAVNPGKVVVVSVQQDDFLHLPHAPSQVIRDVSLEAYAKVLEKVAAQHPRLIVVSWLSGAHPLNEPYLRPVTQTIDRLGINSKTLIALPFVMTGPIPEFLRTHYQFRDADDCVYDVNAFCSVMADWDWIIQALIQHLWSNPPPSHISKNLPHALPNMIINLPEETSIPEYSFTDILQDKVTLEPNAVVMIGDAVRQDPQFRDSKYVIQRTFSAGSNVMGDLTSDGITFHKFWAQIAQMLIDRTTVGVPQVATTRLLVILSSLILIGAIVRFNLGFGFVLLLFYTLALPLLNIFSVKYLKLYVPIFNIIYAGAIVYIAAAFSAVSIRSYQRWRLVERQKSLAIASDLKSNFISLISHNLNTPVAKLRGLVDILQQYSHAPQQATWLRQISILVSRLQLCIRSVLMSTSLEEGALHAAPHTVQALIAEFDQSVSLTLRRMGINLKVHPDLQDDTAELWFQQFSMDVKIVAQALGALAAFGTGHWEDVPKGQWDLFLALDSPTDQGEIYLKTILQVTPAHYRASQGSEAGFFDASQLSFLELATARHGGGLEVVQHGDVMILTATWLRA